MKTNIIPGTGGYGMIIDAHIHLWDRLHGEGQNIQREALTWGKAREEERIYYATPPSFDDSLSTYERALAHMAWLGIDGAVVLQEFMDGKQDDYLYRVRRMAPDKFSCMALFDDGYLDDPLAAFNEAVERKKLQGFLVKTPYPFPEIAIDPLLPLWKLCGERGLPVVLKNGRPSDVAKLIKKVPGLKVVFSHFAGVAGDPRDNRERLAITADNASVFIDSGGLVFRQPYPFDQAKENLHEAVEKVGARKIAWGTDYPRPGLTADISLKQQLDFITLECDFQSETQKN
jgi:predicted TIM-barrel fold metal-dependent hydrolase